MGGIIPDWTEGGCDTCYIKQVGNIPFMALECGICDQDRKYPRRGLEEQRRIGIEQMKKEIKSINHRKNYIDMKEKEKKARTCQCLVCGKVYKKNNNKRDSTRHICDICYKGDRALINRFVSFKVGAIERGYDFELTLSQFDNIVNNKCYYCGGVEKIGVDRGDNEKGYTLDNSVPCCGMCNLMKYVHTEQKFISHAIKIAEHQKVKNCQIKEA